MMKHLITALCGICFSLLFLTGCVEPVVFAEALQMKVNDKVYTACNIWYEDPEEIDCRNIQRGSFIPVGTEVIPVETTAGNKIIFKDTAGKKYIIKFSSDYRLCSMADYVAYTFTTKNREALFAGIDKTIQMRILRGEVVPGMKTEHVKLAYGLPPAIRTPDLRNESWLYFLNENDTVRVVLRGGVVRNVLNLNEPR